MYDVITLEIINFGRLIETCPRPFSKKSEFSISLDQQSEILYSLSLLLSSQGLPKYIEAKVLAICFNLI